ncbi:MAG: outer membrane protein assembly factor BamE, partial [Burkholderiales bacterium]|nr:outer membrane protein assembly factor BamE [Burkholderiales bacterium]
MNQHFLISLRTTVTWGIALPLLFGVLSACSVPRLKLSSDALAFYIPEVVQGNFISREQKEFLKPGMSRLQVREVLG